MTTKQNHNVLGNNSKETILCDFDGTVTMQDVTDEVLKKFANPSWRDIGRLYSNGIISHAEMNKRFAALLYATPTELKSFIIETIQLRNGFNDFVNLCKELGILLIIVSSGWDFYIKASIKEAIFIKNLDEIPALKKFSIPVISNHIIFNKINHRWYLKLPWNYCSCKISSPCKGIIAKLLKKKGINDVISIGNSETDICMAQESDLVFATDSLVDICIKKSIAFQGFKSFAEISRTLFVSHQ